MGNKWKPGSLKREHNCLGYGRASLDKQQNSISVQRAKAESWWQNQTSGPYSEFGWGGWFQDEATTSKINWFERPGAQELLINCQPGDVIVVSVYDRAIRSTADACEVLKQLQKFNLKVMFLDNPFLDTTTIDGEMMFKIVSAITERERQMIGKRTIEQNSWRRAVGLPTNGKPPLGWKIVDGKRGREFAVHKKEREVAEYIVALYDVEGLTFERIYWRFIKEKIPSPRHGREYALRAIQDHYHIAKLGFPCERFCVVDHKTKKKLSKLTGPMKRKRSPKRNQEKNQES